MTFNRQAFEFSFGTKTPKILDHIILHHWLLGVFYFWNPVHSNRYFRLLFVIIILLQYDNYEWPLVNTTNDHQWQIMTWPVIVVTVTVGEGHVVDVLTKIKLTLLKKLNIRPCNWWSILLTIACPLIFAWNGGGMGEWGEEKRT